MFRDELASVSQLGVDAAQARTLVPWPQLPFLLWNSFYHGCAWNEDGSFTGATERHDVGKVLKPLQTGFRGCGKVWTLPERN